MTDGPLGQCNTCREIYHHSPVVQHVCEWDTGTRDATPEEETMIDEIMRLRAALTASLAREAAAFEAAAGICKTRRESRNIEIANTSRSPVFEIDAGLQMRRSAAAIELQTTENEILALTPADAQAALDRMIADARADGMRVALTWGGMDGDAADRAVSSIIAKIGSAL